MKSLQIWKILELAVEAMIKKFDLTYNKYFIFKKVKILSEALKIIVTMTTLKYH